MSDSYKGCTRSGVVLALENALAEVRKSEARAQERYDRWARVDSELAEWYLGRLSGLARARACIQIELDYAHYERGN